jgi:hypothetical protein
VPPPVLGQPSPEYLITGLSSPSDFTIGPDGAVYYISQWDSSIYKIEYITSGPIPDIKANNSDGPLFITIGETVSIEVALDAGDYSDVSADYWVLAMAPTGEWYYFEYPALQWHYAGDLENVSTCYQGALSDLAPLNIYDLDTSSLPEGQYIFYFAVDTIMNGSIDYSDVYYDWATVNLTP